MLTLSSHKIGGPKGGGALFVKSGTPMHSIINGGGQEQGLRSGTQNVYTAVGLAMALEEVNNQLDQESRRLTQLQSKLFGAIKELKGTVINGSLSHRSPMNINFSWKSYTSDELVIALDRLGFAVSAASACASGSIQKSHVLSQMPIPEWRMDRSVRISLGFQTKGGEITKLIKVLKKLD